MLTLVIQELWITPQYSFNFVNNIVHANARHTRPVDNTAV